MEAQSTRATVNGRAKVLRVVVGKIANARLPLDDEVAVLDAILEPIEMHVNGFGAFLFDSSIEDAAGNTVVSCDDSGRLGPSHFMESLPEWDSGLCIDECRAGLGFGGGRDDVAHDASEDMEGSIERRGEAIEFIGMGAKPKETSGFGASIGLREIGGICVVVEHHVTCKEFDDAFEMGGCIVEQVNAGMGGGFSGAGLLQSNGAKGDKHGVVNGTDTVEEDAHNLADPGGCGCVQRGGGVKSGHLNLGSMLGRHMFVGAVRGGWISVAKTF